MPRYRIRAVSGIVTTYGEDVEDFKEANSCFDWAVKHYPHAEVTLWDRDTRKRVRLYRGEKK